MWLAVAENFQGNGYGKLLLAKALANLDSTRSIQVQTFAESAPVGNAARKLYHSFGFIDYQDAGTNPAGISTVIMCKE